MAHVNSYSQHDQDGIFLYSKGKRISGPYKTEDAATKASKDASKTIGEQPIEKYKKYLKNKPREGSKNKRIY